MTYVRFLYKGIGYLMIKIKINIYKYNYLYIYKYKGIFIFFVLHLQCKFKSYFKKHIEKNQSKTRILYKKYFNIYVYFKFPE